MDDVLFAHLQMAISLAFHIIFTVFGIGIPCSWPLLSFVGSGKAIKRHIYCQALAKETVIFLTVRAVSGRLYSVSSWNCSGHFCI